MKLNLGAGPCQDPEWKSVDLLPESDYVWDLRDGLPKSIKKDSVDEIKAENFFEHLPETHYVLKEHTTYEVVEGKKTKRRKPRLHEIKSRIKLMQHCWDVMKHGAILTIWGPYGSSEGYFGDPTHHWAMGYDSFNYFCVQVCHPDLDDRKLPFHERKLWHHDVIKSYPYEGKKVFEGQFERLEVKRWESHPDFIQYTLKALKR